MAIINWKTWKFRFCIAIIIGTLFACIALFSGGWAKLYLENMVNEVNNDKLNHTYEIGILTHRCLTDQTTYVILAGDHNCVPKHAFENWCITALFFTIFCEIAIIILVILSHTNIKVAVNRRELILTILSGVATLLLLSVVIVYAAKNSNYKSDYGKSYAMKISLGYSYVLTWFALLSMIAATVFGFFVMRYESIEI